MFQRRCSMGKPKSLVGHHPGGLAWSQLWGPNWLKTNEEETRRNQTKSSSNETIVVLVALILEHFLLVRSCRHTAMGPAASPLTLASQWFLPRLLGGLGRSPRQFDWTNKHHKVYWPIRHSIRNILKFWKHIKTHKFCAFWMPSVLATRGWI